MKKRYSHPDIAFESFSLLTSIAGNCEVKTDTKGGECAYPMDACNGIGNTPITDEQSLVYNGFCYHVPVENRNLFNSKYAKAAQSSDCAAHFSGMRIWVWTKLLVLQWRVVDISSILY